MTSYNDYNEKKHLAALCVREAFAQMTRAYYYDDTKENLAALHKVREALGVMLTSYYMLPDSVAKPAPPEQKD